jgi:hypothetical protein
MRAATHPFCGKRIPLCQGSGPVDLTNRGFNQTTVFASLLVGNRCFQVLNFGNAFPNEDDDRDIRDSADPGITNHLGIE